MTNEKIRVSIAGGSGYVGGECLRLLLDHPHVHIVQVTSERFAGQPVSRVHPNLRGRTDLLFSKISDLENVDILFLGLPHGMSSKRFPLLKTKAKKLIDKGGDFRLRDSKLYETYYNEPHPDPSLLKTFVYGIPELHRDEIKNADYVACAGCNATATILGLYPLYKNDLIDQSRTVVDIKAGSSQAGNNPSLGGHHPERSGAVRTYKPTRHRHSAEMIQELNTSSIHVTATSVELVRGVLTTSHVFLKSDLREVDILKVYRKEYATEPFIRLRTDKRSLYRFPEPKILAGSNYCDIGLEKDPESNRVVVVTAIDNLMKGAAGQAVQCMNIMCGFIETTGLTFPGLHPV